MLLINLKNDTISCQIAPEIGGAIYSLDYHTDKVTQNLMRTTWGEAAHLITDFACWPLVPFSNRIRDGRFQFMGQDYQIPTNYLGHPHASHGQAWEHPWQIQHHDASRCDLSFSFDDKTVWPFPYTAAQKFKLFDNGLAITLSMTNAGTQPMPAGIGLHPYFPKPPGTTLQAQVSHLWEIDATVLPTQRIVVPPQYNFATPKPLDQTRLDHCFEGYGGFMEIVWPNRPVKLNVTSSPRLRHFVVYTPEGKDFFCAEPVSHMPDAVNRMTQIDTGLVILNPGESLSADYHFEAVRPKTPSVRGQELPSHQ